jgi:hypothetical protein
MENQENPQLQESSFFEAKKQKTCKIMMILAIILNPIFINVILFFTYQFFYSFFYLCKIRNEENPIFSYMFFALYILWLI